MIIFESTHSMTIEIVMSQNAVFGAVAGIPENDLTIPEINMNHVKLYIRRKSRV